jgi:hypothetical protein
VKTTVTRYNADGEQMLADQRCLVIQSQSTSEAKGTMEAMGMTFHVESQGTSKGTTHFNLQDGVLVQSITDIHTEQQFSGVTGSPGDIATTTTGTMKISLDSR